MDGSASGIGNEHHAARIHRNRIGRDQDAERFLTEQQLAESLESRDGSLHIRFAGHGAEVQDARLLGRLRATPGRSRRASKGSDRRGPQPAVGDEQRARKAQKPGPLSSIRRFVELP